MNCLGKVWGIIGLVANPHVFHIMVSRPGLARCVKQMQAGPVCSNGGNICIDEKEQEEKEPILLTHLQIHWSTDKNCANKALHVSALVLPFSFAGGFGPVCGMLGTVLEANDKVRVHVAPVLAQKVLQVLHQDKILSDGLKLTLCDAKPCRERSRRALHDFGPHLSR